jgi:hypothetical protein
MQIIIVKMVLNNTVSNVSKIKLNWKLLKNNVNDDDNR